MPTSRIYSQIADAIQSNTPCVLATVIHTANSTSATVGDKALIDSNGEITGWIGGGCCQAVVKKVALHLLEEKFKGNQYRTIRVCPENEFVEDMLCYPSHCPSEGTVDIFLEPIANQQTLYLYGNTPIAQSISRYSDELNIQLEWRQLLDQYLPTPNPQAQKQQATIAIIATQGQGDLIALQQALADKAEHILLVASHKKAIALKEKLQQSGACQKTIASIISPAGIDIGASSPAEIALSIMANVVSLQRQRLQDLQERKGKSQETSEKVEKLKAEKPNEKPSIETPKATSSCCGG